MDYGFKLTTNGSALLAACMALKKPLRLTRVAVGSGMVPEGVKLADVHQLYQYVADGAVGGCSHENNILYLTIQYSNSFHKEIPTFYLSEFMVYAEHPETGEDVDLIYATIGDYRQPVPPYTEGMPEAVFNFPLVTIVSSEINVQITASPGLVTHDDLRRLLNEGVIGTSRSKITIPVEGWVTNDEIPGYPFCVDIDVTGATARITPVLTAHPESIGNAVNLCQVAQTLDGALRVYAKKVPSVEIKASLALIGGAGYIGTLPEGAVATGKGLEYDTDGSLSVRIGEGLSFDEQDALTVNTQTVMTAEDLVDEAAIQQEVAGILSEDEDIN